jgi:hypothetical protein
MPARWWHRGDETRDEVGGIEDQRACADDHPILPRGPNVILPKR